MKKNHLIAKLHPKTRLLHENRQQTHMQKISSKHANKLLKAQRSRNRHIFLPTHGQAKDRVLIKEEIIYFEENVLNHEPTPKVSSLVFFNNTKSSTKEQLTFEK